MRTRRGLYYGLCSPSSYSATTRADDHLSAAPGQRTKRGWRACDGPVHKRRKPAVSGDSGGDDFFDRLPDDVVVSILQKLSSSAICPADFITVVLTCKRLSVLALQPLVLSRLSPKSLVVRASRWSDSAHRFLKSCADAGNLDASYTLGMIRFYCLDSRSSGVSLMARAAMKSHAPALYSLAVIQFNGSGGAKSGKDLRAGVVLCARAAFLGHIDALRELGHCLQDGYGVRQNVAKGRRFLVQANARELAAVLADSRTTCSTTGINDVGGSTAKGGTTTSGAATGCPLLSDFGCSLPAPEGHPANSFLVEWFGALGTADGLRMCSHAGCGRPETRRHEFRRCSVCGAVNYCSRACQALDWRLRHKAQCVPMQRWILEAAAEEGGEGEWVGGE